MTLSKTIKAIDAVTATTAGSVLVPPYGGQSGIFQAEISGGLSTVIIRGRCTNEAPWVILESFSETEMNASNTAATEIPLMPELQVVVTSISGATVSAWVHYHAV